jgi:hypothetical protein
MLAKSSFKFGIRDKWPIIMLMSKKDEMKLLSIGDKVPVGNYTKVFSAFSKVLNFSCGDLIVSLCTSLLCPGPYRIILDAESVAEITSMELSKDMLILNGEAKHSILPGMRYACKPFTSECDILIVGQRLVNIFSEFRHRLVPESVLGLLLKSNLEDSSINAILASWYSRGIEHFKQGNYTDAVQCFRHRGLGLTPAGDDFLVGLLLGMAWLQVVQKKELSKIMDLILYESEVKDPLIRTFMCQAISLDLDADWAGFLGGLCNSEAECLSWQEEILCHGASSGADQLSGFYLACALFGTELGVHIDSFTQKEVL